jgi:hypothetical protein
LAAGSWGSAGDDAAGSSEAAITGGSPAHPVLAGQPPQEIWPKVEPGDSIEVSCVYNSEVYLNPVRSGWQNDAGSAVEPPKGQTR